MFAQCKEEGEEWREDSLTKEPQEGFFFGGVLELSCFSDVYNKKYILLHIN